MSDWLTPADETRELAAPEVVLRARAADPTAVAQLAALIADARLPAFVVGAGADDAGTWTALVELAERLRSPVWQELFGARAGFPQDHPLFAGHLPAGRAGLRETLAGHDLVVAVGAPVFRQYPYEPGPLVAEGTRVALMSDDPQEVHRSPADLAVLAPPAAVCTALLDHVIARDGPLPEGMSRPPPPPSPPEGEPLRAGHVLAALAERLPADTVLVEEAPSARPELHARIPARRPLGFLSAAMGGLGFALPAATGLRMALPDRPVVAVVGDGSAVYGIQALWNAARYEVGAVFIVLVNGGYAVMDGLAKLQGGTGPWPSFTVDMSALARGFGCPARRIETYPELIVAFNEVLPGAADRTEPLLLEIVVAPDAA